MGKQVYYTPIKLYSEPRFSRMKGISDKSSFNQEITGAIVHVPFMKYIIFKLNFFFLNCCLCIYVDLYIQGWLIYKFIYTNTYVPYIYTNILTCHKQSHTPGFPYKNSV